MRFSLGALTRFVDGKRVGGAAEDEDDDEGSLEHGERENPACSLGILISIFCIRAVKVMPPRHNIEQVTESVAL